MADIARSFGKANVVALSTALSSSRLQDRKILNSWKEIAMYLDRGIRTVQRWHNDLQLPVHKLRNTRRSSVFAFRVEVDEWLRERAKQSQWQSQRPPTQQRDSRTALSAERTTNLASQMLSLASEQRDHLSAISETLNRLQVGRHTRQRHGLQPRGCSSPGQLGAKKHVALVEIRKTQACRIQSKATRESKAMEPNSLQPSPDWKNLYEAALLELNPDKVLPRIADAERALAERMEEIDTASDWVEKQVLINAVTVLHDLRKMAEDGKRC